MKEPRRKTVLIIDGNNLAWKKSAYGALYTKTGVPTTVLTCVLQGIFSYIKRFDAFNVVICWDKHKSRRRLKLFPGYKGNRQKDYTDEEQREYEDFIEQMETTQKVLSFLKVPQLIIDHMEADDSISLVASILSKKYEAIIISADKDLLQCVGFNVSVFSPFAKKLYTMDNFIETTTLSPQQYLFARALMGDRSDCINGIRGVGEVTAYEMVKALRVPNLQFLRQFMSTNPNRNKVMERVENESEIVERNLKLMQLPSALTDLDEEERKIVENKLDKRFLKGVIISRKQIDENQFGRLISKFELFNTLNIKTIRLLDIELI